MSEEKYQKYKMKYLNLKKQMGGDMWIGQFDIPKNGVKKWLGHWSKTEDKNVVEQSKEYPFNGKWINDDRNILLIEFYKPAFEKIELDGSKKTVNEFIGKINDYYTFNKCSLDKSKKAVGKDFNHMQNTIFIVRDINSLGVNLDEKNGPKLEYFYEKKIFFNGNIEFTELIKNSLKELLTLENDKIKKKNCIIFEHGIHDSIINFIKTLSDIAIIESNSSSEIKLMQNFKSFLMDNSNENIIKFGFSNSSKLKK